MGPVTQGARKAALVALVTVLSCWFIGASAARAELSGNCNSDASIDIADAVFLLDFLFKGGRSPRCPTRCDFAGNGSVDIADAIGILNYIFIRGSRGPVQVKFPAEKCGDKIDNDCDGQVDEGCGATTYSVDLAWDPVINDISGGPEALFGYIVHHGTASGAYTSAIPITRDCACFTLEGLTPGKSYYVAVSAVDLAGNEGPRSGEIVISR